MHNRTGLGCLEGTAGRNMNLKGDDSGERSGKKERERERRAEEKASVVIENVCIHMVGMLAKIRILKVIFVRCQMKMCNILLETGIKPILVIQCLINCLNCVLVLWGK